MKKLKLRDLLPVIGLALGLGLAAPIVPAAMVVTGDLEGSPGETFDVSLVTDQNLAINDLDLQPIFDLPFNLVGFARPGLPAQVSCNDAFGICSYFGPPSLPIAAGTTMATWTLQVDGAAPIGTERPLQMGITINETDLTNLQLGLSAAAKLQVVEASPTIPEPSTYWMVGIGLAALAGMAWRRTRLLALPA